MDDLLGKINVLLRARMRSIASGDQPGRAAGSRRDPDVAGDVAGLRRRLDDAFAHEETLKAQIEALRREAEQHDREADAALSQGHKDTARRSVEAMQRTQRRMTMIEADLAEHQRAARALLDSVNLLESVTSSSSVGDAVYSREEAVSAAEPPSLDQVLEEMRTTIEQYSSAVEARMDTSAGRDSSEAVDDDLERRIARLSRR
ncbi:MAG: hypothetical protein L6Q98_10810 [Anaerolineae bacterium]|nr:hypothetical protein [Anaerolineae bacterium]NUQ02683.1 hypothetical protein [Anaerolineae bacterium]